MEKLYVLYDPKCELCERLKDWLLVQRTWLGLCMVPAGSEKAQKMFPELEKIATCNDLVVVSDDNFSARQVTQFAAFDYQETT